MLLLKKQSDLLRARFSCRKVLCYMLISRLSEGKFICGSVGSYFNLGSRFRILGEISSGYFFLSRSFFRFLTIFTERV